MKLANLWRYIRPIMEPPTEEPTMPAITADPAPIRPVKLGARPIEIDPASSWIVQPGQRPRVGQLVHLHDPATNRDRLVLVVRLYTDDRALTDATLMLADCGVGGAMIPRWHRHGPPARSTVYDPTTPSRWHRLAECPTPVTAPVPYRDVYGDWAALPGSPLEVGALVHAYDDANGRCRPAYISGLSARPDGAILAQLIEAGHGLQHNSFRLAAPVPAGPFDKPRPTFHLVAQCPWAR
jgi:hypothetical protein